MNLMDLTTFGLVGGVLTLLTMATGIGQLLKRQSDTGLNPVVIDQFNLRIQAWWVLCAVLAAAFLLGQTATVVLFGLLSFWALREFITLTPTRMADHRALFWVFFLFTPLQYVLIGMNRYELFSVLIPVYGFLFIPVRIAFAGDYKRYLERCAKIQAGLMICVYCLSYAPAILYLDIRPQLNDVQASNARLLFFFLLVVALGDAFQYLTEKLIGQHVIAPAISPNRTWEGFLGGVGCATLFGAAMWWATPFHPLEAALMSLIITTMGFAGGLTMSAIKRDRGVKDYGTLIEGHGGVLDRIDSTCFAAPIFYHVTRYLFT
ncbi:MAG: phosphatidate cytidylyltransferase [Planctomycetia bacterium 21-64-5]|nr:MAG: phosphatidate cytidylyltransferase [Planctomycetia bacterium 21-64-5]HQU43525.1 phosphatidate cytidylyltransferase [Pirellulales bacterium]